MNKEDYVSLEVAKMLKEKGYDEPCRATILSDGELRMHDREQTIDCMMRTDKECYEYLCPPLYDAQKWLRVEHGIYVAIISSPITWLYKDNEGSHITHFPVITYRDTEGKTKMNYHQGMNDSEYEKAFNLAILEALKLI